MFVDKGGWVYILQCNDCSYYTGSARNLKERVLQHQSMKGANYTKKRLPVRLVFAKYFDRIDLAFAFEKKIQGWSHKKKQALIRGRFDLLPELSKNNQIE